VSELVRALDLLLVALGMATAGACAAAAWQMRRTLRAREALLATLRGQLRELMGRGAKIECPNCGSQLLVRHTSKNAALDEAEAEETVH
jgi:DNA-directed RNA polymerase subunit RPC12/RpoP